MTRPRSLSAVTLTALVAGSALLATSRSAASGTSTPTYKAGTVRFTVAFSSEVKVTTLSKTEPAKVPNAASVMAFLDGVSARDAVSGAAPRPTAFEVQVITFGSVSASRSFFQVSKLVPGARQEMVGSRAAYGAVGTAEKPNSGNGYPEKCGSPGSRVAVTYWKEGADLAYRRKQPKAHCTSPDNPYGGSPVPDKNAIQGDLVVLDGKNVVLVFAGTTSFAATNSFLGSLKVLS